MARGSSRADSEYANPFGEAKASKPKPEPKPKVEKSPKGDVAATLSKLGTEDFLKALPKELTDTMGKRIRSGIEVPKQANVSYDPGGDEDYDDPDRNVPSAEYWQDHKTEFMQFVDSRLESKPFIEKDGRPGIKDAAGNLFKISSVAYETDKINSSPKEWGRKTVYTLEVNGKKLKEWSRYEITNG